MKKIRVGCVGAGYMADEHLRVYSSREDVDVVGITSRTRAKAEELARSYSIGTVFDTAEDLYETCFPDLVVVAVSELSTHDIAATCFRYPAVTLIEKPVGYNFVEAEEIRQQARVEEASSFVAYNRRYHQSTRRLLSELESNTGLRFVKIQDQQDMALARRHNSSETVVQNLMYANSIHLIDLFRTFCRGSVDEVDIVQPWDAANPGVVIARVLFASGDVGLYEAVWNRPGPWTVTVSTEERRYVMAPLENLGIQERDSRVINEIELGPIDVEFKPGLLVLAEEALKFIRGEGSNLVTLDDSIESMKLVRDIYGLSA